MNQLGYYCSDLHYYILWKETMNILEKVVKSLTKSQLVNVVLELSSDDTKTFDIVKHVLEEQSHEKTLQREQQKTS